MVFYVFILLILFFEVFNNSVEEYNSCLVGGKSAFPAEEGSEKPEGEGENE